MTDSLDSAFMRLALEQAKLAWGLTAPNPMVGAVVVRDGQVVGKGYHHGAGQPHSEPNALRDAGEAASGATLYVTLEPCCTFGRTPPCTEAIKAAGIRRVVIGCLDPNPKHAGRGVGILREAGIMVDTGACEDECLALNRGFFTWITEKRPYVLLKMAMTLDGKIATASGDSKWVTGPEARAEVQRMRRWADAIMVGGETVRQDNPSLLVRSPENWPKQPQRLVWTSRDIPEDSAMLHDGGPFPRRVKPVTAQEWRALLAELAEDDVMVLMLEGGGELAAAALQAGIVDEVAFFVAPKLLCGRGSRPVVGGRDPLALGEALELADMAVTMTGKDMLVTGRIARGDAAQDK